MITEDYCSFEVAKFLKEKGFDEKCRAFYKCLPLNPILYKCDTTQMFDYCTNLSLSKYNYDGEEMNIAAPTHQMTLKWLREKYNILADIGYDDLDWFWNIISISEKVPVEDRPKFITQGTACHKTYEEAVEAALKYVLTNLI